ncbi:MAG: hypothetical protein ABJA79_01885 [Parafilimonas sp.]
MAERDEGKLLIYKNDTISEDIYLNIDLHLHENTILIFYNTKVIQVRILFEKDSAVPGILIDSSISFLLAAFYECAAIMFLRENILTCIKMKLNDIVTSDLKF